METDFDMTKAYGLMLAEVRIMLAILQRQPTDTKINGDVLVTATFHLEDVNRLARKMDSLLK